LITDRGSDGSKIELRRDGNGRLVEVEASEQGAVVALHRLARDEAGRLVAEATSLNGGTEVRWRHDARGRPIHRALANGPETHYVRDPRGNIVSVAHAGQTVRFERDVLGRRTGLAHGATLVESRFDAMGRLLEQRATAPQPGGSLPPAVATLVHRAYVYDRRGLVARIDDAKWGSTSYTHGRLNELVETRNDAFREIFTYDPTGSLSSIAADDAATTKPALPPSLRKPNDDSLARKGWEIGPGNRLLQTAEARFEYDTRGRRTRKIESATNAITTYEWDLRDRLRRITLPDGTRIENQHDAFGRRVRREVWKDGVCTQTTTFTWDLDVVCADHDSSKGRRSFVHDGFVPLLQEERGRVFVVVTDQIGSARELVDEHGHVAWSAAYTAWGKRRAISAARLDDEWSPSCPFGFSGQYQDELTGLATTRHRTWDPEVGRWLSADPLGIGGGANLFGFDGSPAHFVDPLGLTLTASQQAAQWQTQPNADGTPNPYGHSDDWKDEVLPKGTVIAMGEPYPTGFSVPEGTPHDVGHDSVKMGQGLQIIPHAQFGFRKKVGFYTLQEDTTVAVSTASANTHLGAGGLKQYYVPGVSSDSSGVMKPNSMLVRTGEASLT
jgi:RHS repeat-associated protein